MKKNINGGIKMKEQELEKRGQKMKYGKRDLKPILREEDIVKGYVRLFSLDGGISKIYRDGISDIIYTPYKKLTEKHEWTSTDFESNHLSMYSSLKDAELFSEILFSGNIHFIPSPKQSHVHIFKAEGILKEIADIHYPEWTGVLYNLKELTITEQIEEWDHGELIKGKGD